jgi:hypothetical protein
MTTEREDEAGPKIVLSLTIRESDVWLNFKSSCGTEASLSVAAMAENKVGIIGRALRDWAKDQIAGAPLEPMPQTIALISQESQP